MTCEERIAKRIDQLIELGLLKENWSQLKSSLKMEIDNKRKEVAKFSESLKEK